MMPFPSILSKNHPARSLRPTKAPRRRAKDVMSMTAKRTVLIIALAAALLTACGAPEAAAPGTTPPPEPAAEPAPTPDPAGLETMRRFYEIALNDLYYNVVLPDDTGEESYYAVCDVDGDGLNELIIEYNSTIEAGKVEGIYGYDPETGIGTDQLLQYPTLTYYDNGLIRADYSHNQGLAGRFWPFFLYKYNAQQDVYDCVGLADAWDGTLHPENYDGDPFPTEIDKSGEGIVYYLLGPDDSTLGEPVDKSEYELWLAGWIGDAHELTLPKIPLEPESFAEGAGGTYNLWLEHSGERGYYADVTSRSKAQVERFALEVRRSILERDWQALAQCAAFPLLVNGESCPDAGTLTAMAPEVFTDEGFTSALVSETCEEMFFNYEGIIMADGRVHLAEIYEPEGAGELRVIAINTPD